MSGYTTVALSSKHGIVAFCIYYYLQNIICPNAKLLYDHLKFQITLLSTNQRPKTRLHKTKHPTDVKLKGID